MVPYWVLYSSSINFFQGAQWLSGRVLDLRLRFFYLKLCWICLKEAYFRPIKFTTFYRQIIFILKAVMLIDKLLWMSELFSLTSTATGVFSKTHLFHVYWYKCFSDWNKHSNRDTYLTVPVIGWLNWLNGIMALSCQAFEFLQHVMGLIN